jgi:hypothetical protein
MPVPRLFATGLWLGVTATATAVVWTATSLVAADVTDRPAPVVAHSQVVSELASGSATPGSPSTTTIPRAAPAATIPPPARAPAAGPTTTARATPPQTTAPPTTAPSVTPTTATPSPLAHPIIPSTTLTPLKTATYSTAGGVVAVGCSGLLITLLSAIPSNGYAADIVARGPANVDVHFVGSGQDLSVKVVCFGYPLRYDGQIPGR